ncbi:hypothetical protein VTJ04DRAFT_521 [Mycothermus thermophilus]|uniref:uncharacterized protein n=1 Tax=Humicola insolens TaxID=85995 RepID=UPI0037449020
MAAIHHPSFVGFLATPVDAMIVLEAALSHGLFTVFHAIPSVNVLASIIHSGAIVIIRNKNRLQPNLGGVGRWRDLRKWSDRRTMGNGFYIYREMARPNERSLTPFEQQVEINNNQQLGPYMGLHIGRPGALHDGLFKKTVTYEVGGNQYTIMNYYRVTDVLRGRLPRPRHLAPGLTINMAALSADFWRDIMTPDNRSRGNKVVDDGGVSLAVQHAGWTASMDIPQPAQPQVAVPALAPQPQAAVPTLAAQPQVAVPALAPQPQAAVPALAAQPLVTGTASAGQLQPAGIVPSGQLQTAGIVPGGQLQTANFIPAGFSLAANIVPAGQPQVAGSVPVTQPQVTGSDSFIQHQMDALDSFTQLEDDMIDWAAFLQL